MVFDGLLFSLFLSSKACVGGAFVLGCGAFVVVVFVAGGVGCLAFFVFCIGEIDKYIHKRVRGSVDVQEH